MNPSTEQLLDVVALILIQNEKVLVAQRQAKDRLAFKWEFPGGKIEQGETPEAALIREIQEELGIQIGEISHYITTEYNEPPVPIRLHAYQARSKGGILRSKVHHQIRWVAVRDLLQLDLAPADVPLAQAIIQHFQESNS